MKHDELDELLEAKLAKFFGQMTKYVDERIGTLEGRLDERFDRMETTIDALAERVVSDDQERAVMSGQLDRHEAWIGQLAKSTRTKLMPEQ